MRKLKQVKTYPLAKAGNAPAQRFVDMTDTICNGLVRYDESIYTSLARMLNEEPVQPQDLQMMGMLLPLGIEKGKDFKPDAATVAQLHSAAAEAHAWLLAKQPTFVENWWPGSQWKVPILAIGPQTGFKWTVANYFDVDSRGIAFSSFFLPPAKLGGGSFYLGANFDSSGQPLLGENTYRLHVPANADGSVDLYLGLKAPTGQESNWIYTPAEKGWFPWFRFYNPEKPLFDKSWKMPDIEKVK
jgi:hypothetical protein